MTKRATLSSLLAFLLFSASLRGAVSAVADSVLLYTPYTKISVPPGQTISYPIDLINNTRNVIDASILVSGLPSSWKYELKAGDYTIRQISVLPQERKTLYLTVIVPLKVNKGNYPFSVSAGSLANLPLAVNVSEQGTFKSELTAKQPNMQGKAGSTFTFQATLKNLTADKQVYALIADAPPGWEVAFKYNYQQVTSAEVGANSTGDITIDIKAPDVTEAGTYNIPVRATTNSTSVNIGLEVVITGFYGMQLSTPSGLLSTSINANEKKRIGMIVQNTGSTELRNIEMDASAPLNWEVTFDPKKIDRVPAGEAAQVFMIIKPSKQAIAGDYIASLLAKTPETAAKTEFRVSVKTPMIWGWTGILVIFIAIGSIYYLFRTYGRR